MIHSSDQLAVTYCSIVVAHASSIVTHANRSEVTTTEHAAHHVCIGVVGSVDVDVGIAIDLTSSDVVLVVVGSILISVLTFTAAVNCMANETLGKGDVSVVVDVAVFTTAIHSTGDAAFAVGSQSIFIVYRGDAVQVRIVDVDHCGVNIGQQGHRVTVAHSTLTTTIDVTIVHFLILAGDTDTTACYVDGSLTGLRSVGEFVRPAVEEGVCGAVLFGTGNGTYRSDLTAAIHATHHPTAFNVDGGVALNDTGQWVMSIRLVVVVGVVHISTATCAVHITTVDVLYSADCRGVTDTATIDVDRGVGGNVTVLTRTIHGAVHQSVARQGAAFFLTYVYSGDMYCSHIVKLMTRSGDLTT